MKLLYTAGRYRAPTINGIHDNIQAARRVALKYWKLGYAVICPHANTAFMDGACEDQVWLDGDLEMIRRCDVVVMIPGWKESRGAVVEHELAVSLGKEVIYEQS